MYKIALCDDDILFLKELEKMCSDIFFHADIPFSIDRYSSLSLLFETCLSEPERYDLLVLDILLSPEDEHDGIHWGKRLRQHGFHASILYISSSPDYILDGYDVRAIRYIMKPINPVLLEQTLLNDYRTNHIPQRLILTKGSMVTSISFRDILYVESIQRTTILHGEHSDIDCSIHLNDLLDQLPSDTFIRCHQSFILNLSKTVAIRRYEAVLHNKMTVPISKTYYKTVQNNFLSYLRNEP